MSQFARATSDQIFSEQSNYSSRLSLTQQATGVKSTAFSVAVGLALLSATTLFKAEAKDNNYQPGQPIRFNTSSGRTASAGSSTMPATSSFGSSTSPWGNNLPSAGTSFSGTTYSPPSPFGNSAGNTGSQTDPGNYGNSNTGGSQSTTDASGSTQFSSNHSGSADPSRHQGGLSSLLHGVRHSIENAATNSNSAHGNVYPNGQFSGGYTAGSSFSNGASFSNGTAPATQFGGNQPSAGTSAVINYVRMPDGSYRPNGPNVGRAELMQALQTMPRFNGSIIQYVSSDPPYSIDGDIENLLPKELHRKAYGPELHRAGPANGAQDNVHLF